MFRDNHFKPVQNLNIAMNDGGLGDQIARMTAIKYLKENFKFNKINLYAPDYFVDLAKNLVPGINVYKFSNGKATWNAKFPMRQTKNFHSTLRSHIVDNAFHVLCDKQITDMDKKNYCKLNNLQSIDISKFNLPEKYVVITTGFTAEVREMIPEAVNGVAQYLLSKNITPVFLGSKQSVIGAETVPDIIGNFKKDIDYNVGIDLIDKTSLLEAGKIISEAKAIVGLDNGLLHLAGCTDVPIVGGFTTVEPVYRMPYRNNELGWNYYPVVPELSLKCRFCQSNWDFIYNHDFRYCWYTKNAGDKEIKCVQMLKSNLYIEKLELFLN